MDTFINTYVDLFTPKKIDPPNVNIIGKDFYDNLIYNGPPRTQNETPMFLLLKSNMGIEFALKWALEHCDVDLIKLIINPSKEIIRTAIILDNKNFDQFKNQLTEDDLIKIVKSKNPDIFGPEGWKLLFKLDNQPPLVVRAAIESDCESIKAIKNQTPEICEFCVLNNNFQEEDLKYVQHCTDKINAKILDCVRNKGWKLSKIDGSLITRELVEMVLVRDHDSSLKYIFEKRSDLIDQQIIDLSVRNPNSRNFPFVPDNYKTLEMCKRFVKISISNLYYVPSKFTFDQIVEDKSKFKDIYEKVKNIPICTASAKMTIHIRYATRRERFNFVQQLNEDEILTILNYLPKLYCKLTEDQKTQRVTLFALLKDGYNLQYVPKDEYNDELVQIAIASQPNASRYIRQ